MVHQHIKGTEAEEFERSINDIFKKVNLDYRFVTLLLQDDDQVIKTSIVGSRTYQVTCNRTSTFSDRKSVVLNLSWYNSAPTLI